MFDELKKHWKIRRIIRFDRNNLEERARRFLKSYLEADDKRKSQFYRAVEDISRRCQPVGLFDLDDAKIAEATCEAAIKIVQDQDYRKKKDDRTADFVTDASATVAIAYRRAAGVYIADEKMKELGTAAVHLLTMATSYMSAHNEA
jgi:hypothetical protein